MYVSMWNINDERCTMWCELWRLLQSSIHQNSCHILMFINGYITLWHTSKFMSSGPNGYVKFHHSSKFMFLCCNHQWLCHLIYNIHQSSYRIATYINGYVILWHSSRFMLHCDNHQWLCHIVTFIIVNIAFW